MLGFALLIITCVDWNLSVGLLFRTLCLPLQRTPMKTWQDRLAAHVKNTKEGKYNNVRFTCKECCPAENTWQHASFPCSTHGHSQAYCKQRTGWCLRLLSYAYTVHSCWTFYIVRHLDCIKGNICSGCCCQMLVRMCTAAFLICEDVADEMTES